MAQPNRASDQLKQYLGQLSPQVRGRLLAELERLLELGEPIPRTEELIASLRAEFPGGAERRGEPSRLFFKPLEPVLVDGAPERANIGQIARGSLTPIWTLLTTELLSTMAREYIDNVTKVLSKPQEAEKLAVGFQKKALGYLEGTMRSEEGSAKVRASLRMYTSSPAVFDDLAKMFTVFRTSDALTKFAKDLEPKIARLEGASLAKALDHLKTLKAASADAIPFALTIVVRRLTTPSQLLYLATKVAESRAPSAVAATPCALAVSMVLDQIDERRLLLGMALKGNRVAVAKAILKEIYTIENFIKAQIDLGNSDWGNRLRDQLAAVAAVLEADGAQHGLRPGQSLKDRLAQTVQKGRAMIADILPV